MEKPIISIDQGDLIGKIRMDYNGRKFYAFLGIPYAKPPIGELRFKASQPLDKWCGIKNATKDGNECYYKDSAQGIIGSEDCLFLNVFTPELPEKKATLKPVMVWIHGGGFVSGSNKSDMYGPEFLLTEDIVLVSMNYRTGILGFLSADNPELEVSGNAGCKDMILALKWVQRNIQDFGGDPNNVTVFGANAGGTAVHLLVLSPMSEGLFHRAIVQNGSALNPWTLSKSSYKELARTLGCTHTSDEKILRFLQKVPIEELYRGQEKLVDSFSDRSKRVIGPVVERESPHEPAFLKEHPMDTISKGNYNKVPLMIGYTSAERLYFESCPYDLDKIEQEDIEQHVASIFNVEHGSNLSKSITMKIKSFYLKNEMPCKKKQKRIRELLSDITFFSGIYSSIKYHAISSAELTFLYKFSVPANLNLSKVVDKNSRTTGYCQSDELGYLFKSVHHPDIQPGSIEDATIRTMVKLWANFAKTGDPNPINGATWRPVFDGEVNYLEIEGEKLTLRENPETEKAKLWDEIFQLTAKDAIL